MSTLAFQTHAYILGKSLLPLLLVIYVTWTVIYVRNIYWRDLPVMYTQAEGECGYIRQIPTAHDTYVM